MSGHYYNLNIFYIYILFVYYYSIIYYFIIVGYQFDKMSIADQLARAVVDKLQNLRKSNAFSDIVISVQNTEFKCHRFILCACSKFFEDACNAQDESKPQIVVKNISPETFRLVLDIIYGGKDVLTVDNVADVWLAAKQLQVDFLYEACELYQYRRLTMQNCIQLTIQARMLESKKLMEASCDLIAKEFQNVYKYDDFVLLDPEDLLYVISSENMVAPSEDIVVNAILKWAHHTPDIKEKAVDGGISKDSKSLGEDSKNESLNLQNERAKIVGDLLKSCRLCLASGRSLQTLIGDYLIAGNEEAFAAVREALCYQLQPEKHGYYCPPSAVHRKSSLMQNVIFNIFRQPNGIFHCSCRTIDGTWFSLLHGGQYLVQAEMFTACFRTSIYSTGIRNGAVIYMYIFKTEINAWQNEINLPNDSNQCAIICLDHYLYAVPFEYSTTIKRLNLLESTSRQFVNFGNLLKPVQKVVLTLCGSAILILGNEAGFNEITIQIFDTTTMTCSVYESKIQANGVSVVSFFVAEDTYILLATGDLWKLQPCDKQIVKMAYKGKLFEGYLNLNAAVVFNDVLIISASQVNPQMSKKWESSCIDNVQNVEIIDRDSRCLLNTVIPKRFLNLKEV